MNKEKMTTEVFWHEIRRKVARIITRPTFEETYGATFILISFICEMPKLLRNFDNVEAGPLSPKAGYNQHATPTHSRHGSSTVFMLSLPMLGTFSCLVSSNPK